MGRLGLRGQVDQTARRPVGFLRCVLTSSPRKTLEDSTEVVETHDWLSKGSKKNDRLRGASQGRNCVIGHIGNHHRLIR